MFDPRLTNAKNVARRRFEAREVLDREKSKPCKDCGREYHPCQMDFLGAEGGRAVPLARMLHLSINRIMEEIGRSDNGSGRGGVWPD